MKTRPRATAFPAAVSLTTITPLQRASGVTETAGWSWGWEFPTITGRNVVCLDLRACLKIASSAAAGDFGLGRGGADGTSPERAMTFATTKPQSKRHAARRVFAGKAVWLRCSSVEDPQGVFSFVAPRHPAFPTKTAPLGIFSQALRKLATNNAAAWRWWL